ncbi:Nose resistant to fluoxetine protein 6 [Araneus ventricosus]|uniref:Nose resistant to fluoxetine protein 6 n=1 Tax=Araneus ventricosus TaxID=182803 RepID=A0A4Y2CBM2_ARAVE|nr:Nose resistant to fluoxetine protein 6 [Araneus ventricosus]
MNFRFLYVLFLLVLLNGSARSETVNDSITVSGITDVVVEDELTTEVPKQTYKEAEKEITEFINSLLRQILPQIVGGSGNAKLSPQCTAGMMKIFGYVRRMKGWTIKMLDSMGKPASGILKGTAYSMGSYDECLDLSITSKGAETSEATEAMFQGKYCRVKIRFPEVVIETARNYHRGLINASDLGKLKDIIQVIPYIPVKSNYMNHFIGLCFPSTCTEDDLEQLVKLIPFPGQSTLDRCEVKSDTEVDHTQFIIICVWLLIILLVVVSTFIHWLTHDKKDEKNDDKESKCLAISLCFSICHNTSRLMKNIEDDTEGLLAGQSVRGIFVASVAWIIIGHTYIFPYEGYYFQMSSLDNLRKFWDQGYFSVFMSFPLAVDALFVCYGFLLTYSLWQPALKPRDIEVNVISLIVKNYLRLCIPLLLFFGVVLIIPLIASGPFWGDLLEGSIHKCRDNAAAYFGMYSNFLDLEDQCFPHLWFVSCLAQLTLVGIFLSLILARNLKVGIFFTMVICLLCSAAVGILTFNHEFPPSYVAYFTEESSSLFWKINMALPLSHFGPYAAGMLAGIWVGRRDNQKCRMFLGAIGWIACLGILYALHLVLYNSRDGSMSPYWSAVYAAIHRTTFGLCVTWVIIACSFGIGGFVNAIFSWRVFDPLFRLSYYAYIFHFMVISFVVSVARDHTTYSHIELFLRSLSYITVTYFIAYLLYLVLEMPLGSLRIALCPQRTSRIEVTPLNNFSNYKGDVVTKNTMLEGTCKLWSITETHNGISY